MSTRNDGVDEGGAQRPLGVSEDGDGGLARIIQFIGDRAIGSHGEVQPNAASILALRHQETREHVLRSVLLQVCPKDINPELWLKWLAGGEPPFAPERLKKIRTPDANSGRVMARASSRVETARKRVEAARAKLAEEERMLASSVAFDNAVIQWAVSEHIAQLIGPVFAMGPAWTIMRAVSAHVPHEVMEAETEMITDPKRRKVVEDQVRSERADATRRILAGLDLWSGDVDFESQIRDAVMAVVSKFEPRSGERARKGEHVRKREDVVTQARPSATTDRREVLDGMRPAA